MFFSTGALEYFTNLSGKHLCWSLFLRKLQAWACNFIKRDSNTGVFLQNLEIFKNTFFT